MALRNLKIAGLALVTGAIATQTFMNRRDRSAETATPPIGNFVTVDGARIHYTQEGTGPDLILLHGAGGNLREFMFQHVDMLKDSYRVTCFDRPGLGYTDRPTTIDQSVFSSEGESPILQAHILRDAARQLGIKNPIIAGHSFGAIVAMAWSIIGLDVKDDVNASAIVSLAGVIMPWPGTVGRFYTINGSTLGGAITIPLISAFATSSQIDTAVDAIFAPQPVPEGYSDYVGAALAIRSGTFRANVRQVNISRPHVVEMATRYGELSLPIEVVHGDEDKTVPITVHPHEAVKVIPTLNLTTLEGVGHMPHHADPAATAAAIDRAAVRAGLH